MPHPLGGGGKGSISLPRYAKLLDCQLAPFKMIFWQVKRTEVAPSILFERRIVPDMQKTGSACDRKAHLPLFAEPGSGQSSDAVDNLLAQPPEMCQGPQAAKKVLKIESPALGLLPATLQVVYGQ